MIKVHKLDRYKKNANRLIYLVYEEFPYMKDWVCDNKHTKWIHSLLILNTIYDLTLSKYYFFSFWFIVNVYISSLMHWFLIWCSLLTSVKLKCSFDIVFLSKSACERIISIIYESNYTYLSIRNHKTIFKSW